MERVSFAEPPERMSEAGRHLGKEKEKTAPEPLLPKQRCTVREDVWLALKAARESALRFNQSGTAGKDSSLRKRCVFFYF